MEKMYVENIISIHRFYSEEPFWHSPAPRNAHYLAYHTLGKNTHKTKNKTFEISEDTLLFISKNDAYDVFLKEATESICIVFSADLNIDSFALDCKNNTKIKAIFNKLLANNTLNETSGFFYCLSTIYELFYLIEHLQRKKYHTTQKRSVLQKSVNYIDSNYLSEHITNTQLAQLCNLSERRFTTLFKEHYGETPRKYILRKKIDHASSLLLTKIYTIEQVAEICRFSDLYYFSKMFKKYMNITPGEYKKQQNKHL